MAKILVEYYVNLSPKVKLGDGEGLEPPVLLLFVCGLGPEFIFDSFILMLCLK